LTYPRGLERKACFCFENVILRNVLDVYRTSHLMNVFGSEPGRLTYACGSKVRGNQAAESVWLLRMRYDKVAISVRFSEVMP